MAMFSVASIDRSLAFYRDTLGGELVYAYPPEGLPEFVSLRYGGSQIGMGVLTETSLHGVAQRPAQGHRMELCLYVDDVDAAFDALMALGVEAIEVPRDRDWGERCAFVFDPDGNIVMLISPIAVP